MARPEDAAAESGRLSTEDVYERLRGMILDHTIPPSTRVNIHRLAAELGVSATPVREALRLLQGDNLLVSTSNKGYSTTPVLDAAGVRDLFEFRLLVEPWAARSAATNGLRNPARELARELASFTAGSASPQQHMIAHDSRFHRAIMVASGNGVVLQAFTQTHCHLHLFRMFRDSWDWRTTLEQHRAIADAIADVDPLAAETAMRSHLLSSYEGFMRLMRFTDAAPLTAEAYATPDLVSTTERVAGRRRR